MVSIRLREKVRYNLIPTARFRINGIDPCAIHKPERGGTTLPSLAEGDWRMANYGPDA